MSRYRLVIGVVALSFVALADAPAPAVAPTGVAASKDLRGTKRVKLPAMV